MFMQMIPKFALDMEVVWEQMFVLVILGTLERNASPLSATQKIQQILQYVLEMEYVLLQIIAHVMQDTVGQIVNYFYVTV